MSDAVTIPIWPLVVAWAIIGRLVAGRLMDALETRKLIGTPTLGDKFWRLRPAVRVPLFLAGTIAVGPAVWLSIAWAYTGAPLVAAVRKRLNTQEGSGG